RSATAAALADDLQNFLDGQPLSADEPESSVELTHVPGYEVWQELARGSIWAVYKARDVRERRLVALKRLRPGSPLGPQHLARLRGSVEAARALNHPNIATIHEVGGGGQRLFVAEELVEGGRLDHKLGGRPVDVK